MIYTKLGRYHDRRILFPVLRSHLQSSALVLFTLLGRQNYLGLGVPLQMHIPSPRASLLNRCGTWEFVFFSLKI